MGENLFLSSFRFQQPLTRICRATVPYWLILVVAVLVITYLPLMIK
jgi:TRAP-type C4-dicarboxylate transport system permease large subunit